MSVGVQLYKAFDAVARAAKPSEDPSAFPSIAQAISAKVTKAETVVDKLVDGATGELPTSVGGIIPTAMQGVAALRRHADRLEQNVAGGMPVEAFGQAVTAIRTLAEFTARGFVPS